MNFTIDVKGLDEAIKKLSRMPELLMTSMKAAMTEATMLVWKEVGERTPVAFGTLRGSIKTEVRGTRIENLRGKIFTTFVPPEGYAPYVEEGTRPHWTPIAPLKLWAKRMLGNEKLAYAIRWSIHLHGASQRARQKYGTKGYHMFKRGLGASRDRLPAIFERHVKDGLKKLTK